MTVPHDQFVPFAATGRIRHGFFGRAGGVSIGPFAGLNVSVSTGDEPAAAQKNRALVADALGGGPLVIVRQVHSNRVVSVGAGDLPAATEEADALVTRRRDVLLGILTADCAPLLLLDAEAGVVGAAHAGWRGAVDGILGNTVAAMEALGAERGRIQLAIGPTISGVNYEVGEGFRSDVLALHPQAAGSFFTPPGGAPHFDLPGFLLADAARLGLVNAQSIGQCTYGQPERYFSHRYATHQGDRTGRQIAVIGLTSQ